MVLPMMYTVLGVPEGPPPGFDVIETLSIVCAIAVDPTTHRRPPRKTGNALRIEGVRKEPSPPKADRVSFKAKVWAFFQALTRHHHNILCLHPDRTPISAIRVTTLQPPQTRLRALRDTPFLAVS